MKQLIQISVLMTSYLIAAVCYADDINDNTYIGIQLGYADTKYSASSQRMQTPVIGAANTTTDNNGPGGRVFLGKKYSDYLAVELGFTYFDNAEVKNMFGVPGAKAEIKPRAGDLVAKVTYPFIDDFGVYARLGVAYSYASTSLNSTAKTMIPAAVLATAKTSDENRFRMTYGVGGNYRISEDMLADIAWMQVQGGNGMEDATLLSLGIIYFFN